MTRTLDLGRYENKVCGLLTSDQQASIEVPPQVRQTASICEFEKWEPKPHVRFAIQLFPDNEVFTGAYEFSNADRWQQFRPITVGQQPAVVRSFGPAGANLECEVVIGTGPRQGVQVSAAGMDDKVDWCGKAIKAAEFVVGNLGG